MEITPPPPVYDDCLQYDNERVQFFDAYNRYYETPTGKALLTLADVFAIYIELRTTAQQDVIIRPTNWTRTKENILVQLHGIDPDGLDAFAIYLADHFQSEGLSGFLKLLNNIVLKIIPGTGGGQAKIIPAQHGEDILPFLNDAVPDNTPVYGRPPSWITSGRGIEWRDCQKGFELHWMLWDLEPNQPIAERKDPATAPPVPEEMTTDEPIEDTGRPVIMLSPPIEDGDEDPETPWTAHYYEESTEWPENP